jgi:hypothetical protein
VERSDLMTLIVEPARPGVLAYDSLPFSKGGTPVEADAFREAGAAVLFLYLGVAAPFEMSAALNAGLGVMGVTLAGACDGQESAREAQKLGLPAGVTLFLDLEGMKAFHADPVALRSTLDGWARAVVAAGYVAGLYVAPPQPLTSDELYEMPFTRYWKGGGSIRDRYDALAEPRCGWCCVQGYPSVDRGGVLVDANLVTEDFYGRLPTWVRASDAQQ